MQIKLTGLQIKSVNDYCKLNNIDDVDSFVNKCFKRGYDVEVYGLLGNMGGIQEKRVEIEVIREIRVEVPVEVIKEVEKIVEVIKEVPVEKIIEKIIQVSDDTQINELNL